MSEQKRYTDVAARIVELAKKKGADVAEVCVRHGSELSVDVRHQKVEHVHQADSCSVGLRVMVGERSALTSTSDLRPEVLENLVHDVMDLVKLSEPDPYAGPPDASLLSHMKEWKNLDTFDENVLGFNAERAIELAMRAEATALQYDKRITNSEGASASRQHGGVFLQTSGGFQGFLQGTYVSLSVQPIADDKDGKKRRSWSWTGARFLGDMHSPEAVGTEAAQRTVARLGERKIPSAKMPVIFDREVARSLVGTLAGCAMADAIWRRQSFLINSLGQRVASDAVTIIDDPGIARAPASRPFDGEGLLSRLNTVVEGGILNTFLTDAYGARRLNMPMTASAGRGGSGGVSPTTTNCILKPGTMTCDELVRDTGRGFYVTSMMGYGFNPVTGDYSRGASGFLIENGQITQPVSEVTVSLNLKDLFQRIDAVGSDLDTRSSTQAPSFRVSEMTVAGT